MTDFELGILVIIFHIFKWIMFSLPVAIVGCLIYLKVNGLSVLEFMTNIDEIDLLRYERERRKK